MDPITLIDRRLLVAIIKYVWSCTDISVTTNLRLDTNFFVYRQVEYNCIPANVVACLHYVLSSATLFGNAEGRPRQQYFMYSCIPNTRAQFCTRGIWKRLNCSNYGEKKTQDVLTMLQNLLASKEFYCLRSAGRLSYTSFSTFCVVYGTN